MTNCSYRRLPEMVATCFDGIDVAMHNDPDGAAITLRHIDWFEMTRVADQVGE